MLVDQPSCHSEPKQDGPARQRRTSAVRKYYARLGMLIDVLADLTPPSKFAKGSAGTWRVDHLPTCLPKACGSIASGTFRGTYPPTSLCSRYLISAQATEERMSIPAQLPRVSHQIPLWQRYCVRRPRMTNRWARYFAVSLQLQDGDHRREICLSQDTSGKTHRAAVHTPCTATSEALGTQYSCGVIR